MHRITILLIWLGGFFPAEAQTTPEILQTQQLKRGIYRTYSEFLRNAPSIRDSFQVITRASDAKIEHGDAVYRLVMLDSAVRFRDARKFWGACDGKYIFVNEQSFTYRFNFRRMKGLGRYCFLMASEPSSYGGSAVLAAAGGLSFGEMYYVLNINSGKFFQLGPKTMEAILAKEQPLLLEYQNAKRNHREEVMVDFLKRYNAKHLHEADTDLWFGRDVTLYRGDRRELPEPIRVTINDTLSIVLEINQVHKLKLEGESINLCVNADCKVLPLSRKDMTYILAEWKRPGAQPSFITIEPFYAKDEIQKIYRANNK